MSAPVTPQFTLTDHDGRPVSELSYRGRFALVYFGFTHCRVVCPRSLGKLGAVLARVDGRGGRVQGLYITVDPERDTPEVMRDYLRGTHARFTGLTGSAEQIDRAKRNFRVFAERRDDPEEANGYAVPHTAIAYLISPSGDYRAHFVDSLDEKSVADRLTALLEEEADA